MNNLKPKQQKAITLLAQGMSGAEVSEKISVAPQTICEWRKSPEFMAEFNNFRYELLEVARSQLQNAPSQAVATLIELMEGSENDETRRKASIDILRLCGFEPGSHECYGWGIGPRDTEGVMHDMNGTIHLHNMLKKIY